MDWKNRCNPYFISMWIFAIIVKTSSLARTLSPVDWDMHNSKFSADGITIEADINDVIDIICPKTNDTVDGRMTAQYHTFTKVPFESYENCNLTAGDTYKYLLYCNRPFVENKYTLLFQAWTPYPGGSIFEAGKDYYYITTSNGTQNGIDSKQGGLCDSHNMKLKVHIKGTAATINPQPATQPRLTTPYVHTTTRKAIETTKSVTDEVKPTNKMEVNRIDKQTGSANMCQMSSLLLLVSCLMARVRWH